jgi:hypothetical protein
METSAKPLGPFFDYSARMDELRGARDSWARLTARAVLDQDFERANYFARLFSAETEAIERLEDWFGDWSQTDARWVGFEAYKGF